MGDDVLAKRVAERFLLDIPSQLASLAEAINKADATDTRFKAHSIKGAAANASLGKVRTLAEQLERLGDVGDLITAKIVLPQLKRDVDSAAAALRDFCNRQQ